MLEKELSNRHRVTGTEEQAQRNRHNRIIDRKGPTTIMGEAERLVYLAAEVNPPFPQNGLMKLVNQGDLLKKVASLGIQGASKDYGIPVDQLENLYSEGSSFGRGSQEEFRILLSSQMLEALDLKKEDLPVSEYLQLTRRVAEYSTGAGVSIIETDVVDLSDDSNFDLSLSQIPKWNTGFTPLDALTGGHYQSIMMLIGRPGHGKTSLMLSILEGIITTDIASSVWFFELEIPSKLMLYRILPIRERVAFRKGKDLLLCGNYSIDDVIEKVKADPDPDRIIFIDSPDVMAADTGEDKRFKLEQIYLKLIQLKWLCKAVIVATWPRRNDRSISLESAAEAWAKAWYSDIIIGLNKLGQARGGKHNVRLNIVKNRFGPSEQETTFQYDFVDLDWDYAGRAPEEDW